MKKVIWGMIVTGLLVFVILTWQQIITFLPRMGQESCKMVMEDGSILWAENRGNHGYLYRLDQTGCVCAFLPTNKIMPDTELLDIAEADGRIYVIGRSLLEEKRYGYSLACFQNDFSLEFIWECTEFSKENTLSHLSVSGNMVYLVFLSEDRKEAMVYSLDWKSEKKVWQPVLKRKAEDKRSYIEAVYQDNQLRAWLDNGTGERIGSDIKLSSITAEADMYLSFLSQILFRNILYFLLYLALFGIPFLGICNRHSFALQRFSVMELIFILLLLTGICFCIFQIKGNRREDRMAYARAYGRLLESDLGQYSADMDLEAFADSDSYQTIRETLLEYLGRKNPGFFLEAAVYAWDDSGAAVVVSAQQSIGSRAEEKELCYLLEKGRQQNREISGFYTRKGQRTGVFVIPDSNTVIAKYALVLFVSMEEPAGSAAELQKRIIWGGISVFLAGTLLLSGITWRLSVSVQRFSRSMEQVAKGQCSFQRPLEDSDEMNDMWNSLSEIKEYREYEEYRKQRMLQAYSRFVPKQIETLLGKSSITEIHVGDSKKIMAGFGLVCMEQRENVWEDAEQKQIQMEYLGKFLKKQNGILLDADSELNTIKLLFPREMQTAAAFGTEFLQEWYAKSETRDRFVSVLIHWSEAVYGIVGLEDNPIVYLASPEITELLYYTKKLEEHRIKMAVTEAALPDGGVSMRYLGFLQLKEGKQKMDLYEILDACREDERRNRIQYRASFQEAVQLYYKNDFYLARNMFIYIMKNCPSDYIAKWYLFRCEEYLNQSNTDQMQYGLFAQE